jgi:hypothetical protein
LYDADGYRLVYVDFTIYSLLFTVNFLAASIKYIYKNSYIRGLLKVISDHGWLPASVFTFLGTKSPLKRITGRIFNSPQANLIFQNKEPKFLTAISAHTKR